MYLVNECKHIVVLCMLALFMLFTFVAPTPRCFAYDSKETLLCEAFPVRYVCDNETRFVRCFCLVHTNYLRLFDFMPVNLISEFQLWKFPTDHRLYETFPVDPRHDNVVRKVSNAIFSVTYPTPFKAGARLVAVSDDTLSQILDLSPSVSSSQEFLNFVSGKLEVTGALPLSHRYGGHQFGVWADQLGDGRAVMLGEYVNSAGERWELQLKGSGLTPYSRQGDGRAVIRSSVREFLCSEAMHYLGIPTSRAASLVISNDTVIRDQFYDGHPQQERTAIVLRLARSWFRIGSLEILTYSGEITLLRQLVDFVIQDFFPNININDPGKYLAFFQEVVMQTAFLVAAWQSVGFAHGVCNTDNFSLLSITIDYGPFGFLDAYDPKFVPNTSDDEHRYSYENQPEVGAFNLEKLRLALSPLFTEDQRSLSSKILLSYGEHYRSKFMGVFRGKLGLKTSAGEDDENLVAVLLRMMSDTKADFTMTFRELSEISLADLEQGEIAGKFWSLIELSSHTWFGGWVQLYSKRLKSEKQTDESRQAMMCSRNPRYILRNWIAQVAVEATERNNFSVVNKLYRIFQKPFTYQKEAEEMGLADKPPTWASSLKVSCSS